MSAKIQIKSDLVGTFGMSKKQQTGIRPTPRQDKGMPFAHCGNGVVHGAVLCIRQQLFHHREGLVLRHADYRPNDGSRPRRTICGTVFWPYDEESVKDNSIPSANSIPHCIHAAIGTPWPFRHHHCPCADRIGQWCGGSLPEHSGQHQRRQG